MTRIPSGATVVQHTPNTHASPVHTDATGGTHGTTATDHAHDVTGHSEDSVERTGSPTSPYQRAEVTPPPPDLARASGSEAVRTHESGFLRALRAIGEAILEALVAFFTLGQVNIDTETFNTGDRQERLGRDLAREHGGSLLALRDSAERSGGNFREALTREVSQRMLQAHRAAGHPDTPETRAMVQEATTRVVDGMLAELGQVDRSAATTAMAASLGDPWPARAAGAVAKGDDAMQAMLWLMSMQQSGQLEGLQASDVDGLSAALNQRAISGEALMETVSALRRMPAAQREEFLTTTRTAAESSEVHAWATLAREHYALSGNDAERSGVLARMHNTGAQMQALGDTDAIHRAFMSGRLGLEPTPPQMVPVQLHRADGSTTTVEVPVQFHPGVPEDERRANIEALTQAMQSYPAPAIEAVLRGEGDEPFGVQILPRSAYRFHTPHAGERPDAERGQGAYAFNNNQLRFNADAMREEGALHVARHELGHAISDQMHEHQVGSTVGMLNAGSDALDTPLGEHFSAIRARFDEAVLSRRISAHRRGESTQLSIAERQQTAQSVGAVSEYAATGGEGSVDNLRVEEFLVETMAAWADPARRDTIRARDPLMAGTLEAAFAAMERGDMAQARSILLNGPSPATAAHRDAATLRAAGRHTALTSTQLANLDATGAAYALAARSLAGHSSARVDADRARMVSEGESLLQRLDARIALSPDGAEKTHLQAVRAQIDTALGELRPRTAS